MSEQDTQAVMSPDVTLADVDPSILHRSPAEREKRGITDAEVQRAFYAVVKHGTKAQKDLQGVTLPALTLDRVVVEGQDNHPVDLRGATIEGLSARFAEIRIPLLLEGATVGDLDLEESELRQPVQAEGIRFTGAVEADETAFRDDTTFADATFEEPVAFDQTVFDDTVSFEGAQFEAETTFQGATFTGTSNELGENTSFRSVTFTEAVDFHQSEFENSHFEAASFEARAGFQETVFDGDAAFTDCTFQARADFDEARFGEDTSFANVVFHGKADFRGTSFSGGARALEDDATFEGATFHDRAAFRHAKFRYGNFTDVVFEARADFEECAFTADADFPGVRFEQEADFDEARFGEDTDFSNATFEAQASFRGIECTGGANVLEDDLTFEGATFETDAEFHNASLTSANFLDTGFHGQIDFSGSSFSERIDIKAAEVDASAIADFTRAKIKSGRIVQPTEGWLHYDLTLASIGDIELSAEGQDDYRRLLDHFRFCHTEFGEFDGHTFDFSAHRDYLDRNAWAIHEFREPDDVDLDYALPMTAEIVETTYLKAKLSAQELGDSKVAGEFRVKRQQYSRYKNMEVVRDGTVSTATRLKNFGRAAENYFLGLTCGHGMRPIRITVAFVLAPLLFVPFYAFGGQPFRTSAGQLSSLGQLATPEGQAILYENIHFSYISYTTIGYGNIGPTGAIARIFAGGEAYLSTILAALLVYALVKRSEL